MFTQQIRPALVMTAVLCLLTGVVYPGVVTGIAQLLFPRQAAGSLVSHGGRTIGSALIGQSFTGAGYFHGRPSAAGAGYDANASSGSNKGPTDSTLLALVTARTDSAVAAGATRGAVPADLVTASGSGLDPHISPASAALQVARVARARNVEPPAVEALVRRFTEPRQFGILGEARVNILQLNLAVDSAFSAPGGAIR
jgi:K+-transporting ATPase ATPase C chain